MFSGVVSGLRGKRQNYALPSNVNRYVSPYCSLEWTNCSSSFDQKVRSSICVVYFTKWESSRTAVLYRKAALENILKFTKKNLRRILFFSKVIGSTTLLKRDSSTAIYLWIFCRTPANGCFRKNPCIKTYQKEAVKVLINKKYLGSSK